MTHKSYVNSYLHPVGKGFFAEIILDRPKALNALSLEMFQELQKNAPKGSEDGFGITHCWRRCPFRHG